MLTEECKVQVLPGVGVKPAGWVTTQSRRHDSAECVYWDAGRAALEWGSLRGLLRRQRRRRGRRHNRGNGWRRCQPQR